MGNWTIVVIRKLDEIAMRENPMWFIRFVEIDQLTMRP